MSELKFEVGKKYRFVVAPSYGTALRITTQDGVFTCSGVNVRGNCWSEDSEFEGRSGKGRLSSMYPKCTGWAVATSKMLNSGEVVEVTE